MRNKIIFDYIVISYILLVIILFIYLHSRYNIPSLYQSHKWLTPNPNWAESGRDLYANSPGTPRDVGFWIGTLTYGFLRYPSTLTMPPLL